MYVVPSSIKGKYVIRFTVTSPRTTKKDIQQDWKVIQHYSSEILGNGIQQIPDLNNKSTMFIKQRIETVPKEENVNDCMAKGAMEPADLDALKMNGKHGFKILKLWLYLLMTVLPWIVPLTIFNSFTIS